MRHWSDERRVRKLPVLLAGERVMACWKGSAQWEPGEVLSLREDGASCAVLFDDQCYDENVPFASVRRMTVIEEVRAQFFVASKLGQAPARRCVQKCMRAGAVCPLDCPYWL